MTQTRFARRRFLSLGARTLTGAGLALGANPVLALGNAAGGGPLSGANLQLGPLADDTGDYRALVCVFLQGGMDGFSLLVPTGGAEHAAYARSRGALALDADRLTALSTADGTAAGVGLHRAAAPLAPLFADGRLGFVANVGNLIEPTTRESYENGAAALPAQLFSHADQEVQWQQLQGRNRGRDGWGALAAERLGAGQSRGWMTSVSLAGANAWQAGDGVRPFSVRDTGIVGYPGLDAAERWQRPRAEAFEAVIDQPRRHVFEQAYADLQRRARTNTAELGRILSSRFGEGEAAIDPVPHDPATEKLAAQLNMVAKMIAVHGELGMRRQIFYVRMGGFDVHDNQNSEQPELFGELTSALQRFQGAIDAFGLSPSVTTFSASDFGRSLTANGDGTDHGWGNHLFAMGGAVSGGARARHAAAARRRWAGLGPERAGAADALGVAVRRARCCAGSGSTSRASTRCCRTSRTSARRAIWGSWAEATYNRRDGAGLSPRRLPRPTFRSPP